MKKTINTPIAAKLNTANKIKVERRSLYQPLPPGGTLDTYQGDWNFDTAAHLMRRASFGSSRTLINEAVSLGLDASVDRLLAEVEMPEPPVHSNFILDPTAPVGQTWVDKPHANIQGLANARRNSMSAWTIGNIMNEGFSAKEKLVLFWHNHFVVAEIQDARFEYLYFSNLRKHALGNFKDFVKAITIDVSMLRYLNGNQNTRVSPNENYARELFELFTVGKGDLAGAGDYTTFTEQDVIQAARILTGWRDVGHFGTIDIDAVFRTRAHDDGDKALSHRFGNSVISNGAENEYANLIDTIFEHQDLAAAEFIVTKLYRWYVYYEITEEIQRDIIVPLSHILIANNFEITSVLVVLLKSEHFYDANSTGCFIKSPIDYLFSFFKPFNFNISTTLAGKYGAWLTMHRICAAMDQEIFAHPEVAGWKAYYQAPLYHEIWINSFSLNYRTGLNTLLIGIGIGMGNERVIMDVLSLALDIENASDPNLLIQELAKQIYPRPIPDEQQALLKEILIPGLPDEVWTTAYDDWKFDQDNQELRTAVDTQLRALIGTMINLPEFYLS